MGVEASAAPPKSVVVIIAANQSLSDRAFVEAKICGIIMPAGWDAAAITFQAGQDNQTEYNLYDGSVERVIPSTDAIAGRMLSLDLNDWLCVNYIRLRSGTSASGVNQTAQRKITLLLAG